MFTVAMPWLRALTRTRWQPVLSVGTCPLVKVLARITVEHHAQGFKFGASLLQDAVNRLYLRRDCRSRCGGLGN
jgi:hypothetical protein